MEQLRFGSVGKPLSKWTFFLVHLCAQSIMLIETIIIYVFFSIRTQSHRWSVYVRGATNEDLSGVIKKVVFQLHPSFNNPVRVVESPPFELSECGWGEFEIAISLHFHDDVGEKKLDL